MSSQRVGFPRTLLRPPPKARRTYARVLANAKRQYGPGERKHTSEKVGDHWETKEQPGPSDSRSLQSTEDQRRGKGQTFGGVDLLGHTRQELYERARDLGIRGRSVMNKETLARAIAARQG